MRGKVPTSRETRDQVTQRGVGWWRIAIRLDFGQDSPSDKILVITKKTAFAARDDGTVQVKDDQNSRFEEPDCVDFVGTQTGGLADWWLWSEGGYSLSR